MTMVYVKRDKSNAIVAVSTEPSSECQEEIDSSSEELLQFSRAVTGQDDALVNSDLPMVRVLDDLIDILVASGSIRFTDFPEQAQQKLFERRSLRQQRDCLTLFADEPEQNF